MAYKQLEEEDTGSDQSRLLDTHSWEKSSDVVHSRTSRYFFLGAIISLFVVLGGWNVAMMIRLADLKQNPNKGAYSAIGILQPHVQQHSLTRSQRD
jgi:hypothetical protein